MTHQARSLVVSTFAGCFFQELWKLQVYVLWNGLMDKSNINVVITYFIQPTNIQICNLRNSTKVFLFLFVPEPLWKLKEEVIPDQAKKMHQIYLTVMMGLCISLKESFVQATPWNQTFADDIFQYLSDCPPHEVLINTWWVRHCVKSSDQLGWLWEYKQTNKATVDLLLK